MIWSSLEQDNRTAKSYTFSQTKRCGASVSLNFLFGIMQTISLLLYPKLVVFGDLETEIHTEHSYILSHKAVDQSSQGIYRESHAFHLAQSAAICGHTRP